MTISTSGDQAILRGRDWTGRIACPPLDSVPSAANTIIAGNGSSSTASNNPAPSAAATIAIAAASRDFNAIQTSAIAKTIAATAPRSETNAIQSLLGHGLNVMLLSPS